MRQESELNVKVLNLFMLGSQINMWGICVTFEIMYFIEIKALNTIIIISKQQFYGSYALVHAFTII